MAALFGKSEEKAAEEAAGVAELERLVGLPVGERAAAVMPAFGPDGPRGSGGLNAVQVAQWLMSSFKRRPGLKPLPRPVQEAVQALEGAGLVEQRTSGVGTGTVTAKATPLGEQALAEGTVESYLASAP